MEKHIYHLTKEQLLLGYDVSVFFNDGEPISASDIRLGSKLLSSLKPQFLRVFVFYIYVILFLIKSGRKFDVIHIHGDWSSLIFVSLLKKISRSKIVVFSVHGQLSTNVFRKSILKFLLKNVDLVFCTGYFSYQLVSSLFAKRVVLQPSGISDLFLTLPSVVTKNDNFQIVTVSNLLPVKNLFFLLEIARRLPIIKFIVIGEGDERERLNSYIQKFGLSNVKLLGFKSENDVKSYCFTSDIFLLTSFAEGTPTSVLEAMSVGLPIVSSNAGGLSFFIKDFSNGFVIDNFSLDEYVDRIMLIKNDSLLRDKIKNNNIELSKNFRWDEVAKSISNIIVECFNG